MSSRPALWLCLAFLFPQLWGLVLKTDQFVASLRLLHLFSTFTVARKVLWAQREHNPIVLCCEAFGCESSEGHSEERRDRDEFTLTGAETQAEIVFSPQQLLGPTCVTLIRAGDGVASASLKPLGAINIEVWGI